MGIYVLFILFHFIFKSSLVCWYNENREFPARIDTYKEKKVQKEVKTVKNDYTKYPVRSDEIIRMLTKR